MTMCRTVSKDTSYSLRIFSWLKWKKIPLLHIAFKNQEACGFNWTLSRKIQTFLIFFFNWILVVVIARLLEPLPPWMLVCIGLSRSYTRFGFPVFFYTESLSLTKIQGHNTSSVRWYFWMVFSSSLEVCIWNLMLISVVCASVIMQQVFFKNIF